MRLLLKRGKGNLIMKDRLLTVSDTIEQVEINASYPHAILRDQAQSGCEICSQAFVGGTETLLLAVAQDLLDTINAKPGSLQLLAVSKNQNVIEKIPFSE
ncbi:hypothetical protein TNCV_2775391 [Trichonephila clavipes]|nr:hypothetical protein TNCV_2775391 [Trichonephila clavipes]